MQVLFGSYITCSPSSLDQICALDFVLNYQIYSLNNPFWNQSNSRLKFPTLTTICSNERPKDVNVPQICLSFHRWGQWWNLGDMIMLPSSLRCKSWEALASLNSWVYLDIDDPFPSAGYCKTVYATRLLLLYYYIMYPRI